MYSGNCIKRAHAYWIWRAPHDDARNRRPPPPWRRCVWRRPMSDPLATRHSPLGMGRIKRVHFVGIGGAGMGGIAEVLLNLGYQISGSDVHENAMTRPLKELGTQIFIGHAAQQIEQADVVVVSTAVQQDNPEVA